MSDADLHKIKASFLSAPELLGTSTDQEGELALIEKAYAFAKEKHKDQKRESGEPYFSHLVETALLACELHLDADAVAAALLHDTIEDCGVSKEELSESFSPSIAAIVDGVSKFTKLEDSSRSYKQARNLKKMLIAAGTDMRVIMVKLCDRLHNMRTLDAVSEKQQKRKAAETKDFYTPIAHRLGLLPLRLELEDLSLRYSKPALYTLIQRSLEQREPEIAGFATHGQLLLEKILGEANVPATVSTIRRNNYYVWRRMNECSENLEEVTDLVNFVIIVDSEIECYDALGAIHSQLRPLPLHFVDHIARPKSNMYQSLHTTVMDSAGNRIPIKIRTHDMNRVTYRGIIEFWYNQTPENQKEFNLSWMNNFLETQKFIENHEEFLDSIRTELFPFEITTLTPRGDSVVLPRQATPLDFAYTLNDTLGNKTRAALVNGVEVPLHHKLNDGDTVELVTSEDHAPLPQWLSYVKLARTRQCIRKYLEDEEYRRKYTLGRELIAQSLKEHHMCIDDVENSQQINTAIKKLGYDSLVSFYCAVATGNSFAEELLPLLTPSEQQEIPPLGTELDQVPGAARPCTRTVSPFIVTSNQAYVLESAPCCDPILGDDIVGVLTQSGQIMVHSRSCESLIGMPELLRHPVSWNSNYNAPKAVRLSICTVDKVGMLKEVVKTISENQISIQQANVSTTDNGQGRFDLELFVRSAGQFQQLEAQLAITEGVLEVRRIVQSR
jgi:guanosine-3',5'-bis(diphosphate) 3'-pyrophosphohydrolase